MWCPDGRAQGVLSPAVQVPSAGDAAGTPTDVVAPSCVGERGGEHPPLAKHRAGVALVTRGVKARVETALKLQRGESVTTREIADRYRMSMRSAQRVVLDLGDLFALDYEHREYRRIA